MSAPQQQANDAEKNIEIWKVKKLIKRLEAARGNGTSMISLIIPPKDQVSRIAKMLAEEFGTASNIKSRVNRLSVLSAITSTQQRLKLYSKVPPNGLVVYCGEIITSEGKERKINIDFEPFKPINTSLYLCDNKFHTEALSELLESDQKFGFIIMDGNGALFGTLSGNTREVVHKFSVDLPKKHGRGGQSALRFARLREEKRHNYVRKVAELAVQNFITNDKVNVAGLILAGSADFKNDLNQSDMFDQRLQSKVIKVVDVSYGGENGFNQAIELASETLSNVKFIQEKKLINRYFDEISQDSGKVCYGIDDTLKALEAGAAETLIVYENLEITRWELKNSEASLCLSPPLPLPLPFHPSSPPPPPPPFLSPQTVLPSPTNLASIRSNPSNIIPYTGRPSHPPYHQSPGSRSHSLHGQGYRPRNGSHRLATLPRVVGGALP